MSFKIFGKVTYENVKGGIWSDYLELTKYLLLDMKEMFVLDLQWIQVCLLSPRSPIHVLEHEKWIEGQLDQQSSLYLTLAGVGATLLETGANYFL